MGSLSVLSHNRSYATGRGASFGTSKRMTTGGRFLTRGLQKVRGEVAPSGLHYHPGGPTAPRGEARLSSAKRPRKTAAFDFSHGLKRGRLVERHTDPKA
jgi:hypothetical protein